jgi:hypothetical protein
VLVALTCNPSYSEGRDQEDQVSKPARANSFRDPISKIPITKGLAEWLKVKILSSSPSAKKQNKTKQQQQKKWKRDSGDCLGSDPRIAMSCLCDLG